jgi:origin recognition complex subunit 2
MATPRTDRRRSTRLRQSINYVESPETVESPRKSLRTRTPNQRFKEIDEMLSSHLSKCGGKRKIKEPVQDEESSIEVISLDSTFNESYEKENTLSSKAPPVLFEDEEDVDGKKLYSFKTPKKGGMMAQLAANQTPKTPKNSSKLEVQTPTSRPSASKCTKTPRHVRLEMKRSEC